MKPIRWRKGRATVEGVRVECIYLRDGCVLSHGSLRMRLPNGCNQQQIDAAAYALADLVATLRGFA